MASRRELKKNVNYIAGELFTECLINSMLIPGTDKAKADELMAEVLKMQDEFVTRISNSVQTLMQRLTRLLKLSEN